MEEKERLQALLSRMERSMMRRVLIAMKRSPEDFRDELATLDLVLEVKMKLAS